MTAVSFPSSDHNDIHTRHKEFVAEGGHSAHHPWTATTPEIINHPHTSSLPFLPIFPYGSISNAYRYVSHSDLNLCTPCRQIKRREKENFVNTFYFSVVVLPRSVLLEQARGTEIADHSPRSDPEIPHIYDVLLSKWSQDHTVFHNVFCCGWHGLAEVAGVVSGYCFYCPGYCFLLCCLFLC